MAGKKTEAAEKMPSVSLLELFCIFFYVGLFTIGGGLVAITLMQQTIVERGLISPEQFYNMVAVSESTPGPIGVNMATYIGYELYGIPGGIIVTCGQVLPSLICILIIARCMMAFQNRPAVKTVFSTLRPAATGLVMVAVAHVFALSLLSVPESAAALRTLAGWSGLFKWKSILFYAAAVFFSVRTKLHPAFLILFGALFGILFL